MFVQLSSYKWIIVVFSWLISVWWEKVFLLLQVRSLIPPQTSKRFTEILLWKRHETYPDDKVCDVTQALPNGERCIHIPIYISKINLFSFLWVYPGKNRSFINEKSLYFLLIQNKVNNSKQMDRQFRALSFDRIQNIQVSSICLHDQSFWPQHRENHWWNK